MIAALPRAESSFPYDNPIVGIAYGSLAIELANAIDAIGTPYFRARAIDYLAARRTFKGLLKRNDFQRFEEQCQEQSNSAHPALLVRRLLDASLRHDRESAVKLLGEAEAVLERYGSRSAGTPLSSFTAKAEMRMIGGARLGLSSVKAIAAES